MEEAAIKAAPVTRLRRRLSVEQQDEPNSPTPSTPSTPTKKRGRLAAKPQLDLIAENDVVVESPNKRTTRKSISREAEADKTLTPSRRSTRTRSNTSLVDKEDEEKLLTPGRRTTRVKSNTSLLSEISVPAANSPRAQRATRRASLLDSDNESALTPSKSRRNRKDSSVEIPATPGTAEDVVAVKPAKITRGRTIRNSEDDASFGVLPKCQVVIDKIPEEETSHRKSLSKDSQISPSNSSSLPSRTFSPSPNTARKSPRLTLKKPQDQTSPVPNNSTEIHDISVSSTNLINNMDKKPNNNKTAGLNKSTSAIDSKDQSNRLRTRSCATLVVDPASENLFFSDNEKIKNKKQRKLSYESKQGSNQNVVIDVPTQKLASQKKKKQNDYVIVSDSTTETALINKSGEELGLKPADTSNDSNKDNEQSKTTNIASSAAKCLFETNPAASIQSLEIIEDSDSADIRKVTNEIKPAEDQCVPVVLPEIVTPVPNLFAIQSCDDETPDDRIIEPMDIDETMPSNLSLIEFNRSRNSSLCMPQNVTSDQKTGRKSSMSILSSLNGDHTNPDTGDKKSNRKSSISKDDKSKIENTSVTASKKSPKKTSISNVSQNIEQSEIGNKSALVISEPNVSAVFATNTSKTVKCDKSPRKSSISKDFDKSVTENTKSPRKSSISKDFDKCTTENTSLKVSKNKSPRKSLISKDFDKSVAENTSLIASSNKSLRKSSISKHLDLSVEATSKNVSLNDNSTTKVIMDGVPRKNPKKNTLMPCLTSTPVQDTSAKKHQINTSTAMTPVKTKALSESNNSTISERSDSDDDSSKDRNDLLYDEAMDAGDDYQSGDSQDEEERMYERVNEIVDRGETLTSEDNVSNDSEYEKDSFLVSSDQEDPELLSGSGDDLDMSDNELTMSKKSKKKFNDRKSKEQKAASREMYEARHQMSSQDVNKNGRSRIDSTLLHSEDDNKVPPKKNKRMRIESETSGIKSDLEKSGTENTSTASEIGHTKKKTKRLSESFNENTLNENELTLVDDCEKANREIGHKKKKSKRLSESFNESALNENEMTIVAGPETHLENDDPLVVNVKPEPKTPLKDFNMSTIHFTDREDVEQVEVQENVTMMKSNETSDPLQDSFDEIDDESISENEEATKNYESILENLKNEHKLSIKSQDLSLNLPIDKSQKPKVPILEELNITTSKVKAGNSSRIAESGTNKSFQNAESATKTNKIINIDESSSESIDFKLLFSEESNDGDKGVENNREDTKTPDKNIPLKRCYGKTNIRENIDEADSDNDNLPFFIDTEGTYGNVNDETIVNFSTTNTKYKKSTSNTSASDKQNKTTFKEVEEDAVSMSNINENKVIEGLSDDNKDNMSHTSKKQKSFIEDTVDSSLNTSKNKHKKAEASYVKDDANNLNSTKKNKIEGKSINNVKSKKNKKVDTIQDEDLDAPEEISSKKNKFLVEENNTEIPVETSFSKKSKKNKKVERSEGISDDNKDNLSHTSKKQKSFIEDTVDSSHNTSKIKNKKADSSYLKDLNSTKNKKVDTIQDEDSDAPDNTEIPIEPSTSKNSKNNNTGEHSDAPVEISSKKNESLTIHNKTEIHFEDRKVTSKNKSKKNETSTVDGEIANKSLDKSSKKNSKKSKSKELCDEVYTEIKALNEDQSNVSLMNANKKSEEVSQKSKETKTSESKEVELMDNYETSKKKRKRLLSTQVVEEQECVPVKHTKKPKIADSIDSDDQQVVEKDETQTKKKNKHSKREIGQTSEPQVDTQSKKRKNRDEDSSGMKSKVMKQDLFHEIHVPRLPDAILNQLDDKSRQEILDSKKSQVVSTTDFNVETIKRRRNKPSNFLEESVFLNHYTSPVAKKEKPKKSFPKILPFIPVASTSDKGFTTNFQVKVLTTTMEFVAKTDKSDNFKTDYLMERRKKKLRTNDINKKHRNVKLSKF